MTHMTRRYRPRPRIGCYPGCIGCSVPLLAGLAVLVWVLLAVL